MASPSINILYTNRYKVLRHTYQMIRYQILMTKTKTILLNLHRRLRHRPQVWGHFGWQMSKNTTSLWGT